MKIGGLWCPLNPGSQEAPHDSLRDVGPTRRPIRFWPLAGTKVPHGVGEDGDPKRALARSEAASAMEGLT